MYQACHTRQYNRRHLRMQGNLLLCWLAAWKVDKAFVSSNNSLHWDRQNFKVRIRATLTTAKLEGIIGLHELAQLCPEIVVWYDMIVLKLCYVCHLNSSWTFQSHSLHHQINITAPHLTHYSHLSHKRSVKMRMSKHSTFTAQLPSFGEQVKQITHFSAFVPPKPLISWSTFVEEEDDLELLSSAPDLPVFAPFCNLLGIWARPLSALSTDCDLMFSGNWKLSGHRAPLPVLLAELIA